MLINGYGVIVSRDYPKYVLPAEILPGVPWPPGFRDEINTWSRSFLGVSNAIIPGQYYVMENEKIIVVHPSDYAHLKAFENKQTLTYVG